MYTLRKRLALAALMGCLVAGPAYGQTCTSTIPDIELRCRNAILVHKAETASVADRLDVCVEDRDEARGNADRLTQALQERPAASGQDNLLLGIGLGAGATGLIALAIALLAG